MDFRDFLAREGVPEKPSLTPTLVILHKLNNDGQESRMQSNRKVFETEEQAREQHRIMVKLSPSRKVRHNLYLGDGTVELLT